MIHSDCVNGVEIQSSVLYCRYSDGYIHDRDSGGGKYHAGNELHCVLVPTDYASSGLYFSVFRRISHSAVLSIRM